MERADNSVIYDAQVSTLENDPLGCKLGGRINGLYYYYLEEGLFASGDGADNTSILGTTDAICNVAYVPFFQITSNMLHKIPYDTDRFGEVQGASKPSVFRVNPLYAPIEKELATKKLYNISKPSRGTKRHYKYESKLHDYPYRTILFYSNIFDKYEVKPHLVNRQALSDGNVKLMSFTPLSPQGTFYLNVPGYKSDNVGSITERYFVNSSFDIPNTSRTYSNYIASQKARTSVATQNSILSAGASVVSGAMSGAMMGGPQGALIGGAMGLIGGYASTMSTINNNLATKKDMITTPNSLISAGGDILTRMEGQLSKVYVGEMSITDEYKQKLGDYFAMFGYKQNKIIDINRSFLRSRYYYNYIRTVGVNIGGNIPDKYLNKIKNIFDNGVTLWHVDREGVRVSDYQYENVEV